MSQFIEMFGNCSEQAMLSTQCDTFIDGDWIESKDQSEEGIRLIQTGNIGLGFFKDKDDKSRYISEDSFKKLNCTEIMHGDILVSRLPDPIGRACVIPEGIGKAITAVDCTIIRLKEILLPEYFISFTMTALYTGQINKLKTGTTRLRVSRGNLGKIMIPIPPIELQQKFAGISQQADKSEFDEFKSQFIEMFGNAEKTKPLSEYIEVSFPGEWGTDDNDGTGVKVIRTTNFTNEGKLDLSNVVTRNVNNKKIQMKKLTKGDIILERSGGTSENPVGRVVYFDEDGDYLFNNFTQLLRPESNLNSKFVFYSLFAYYQTNKDTIRSMGNKTTGIQNLKMEQYWNIPIADASLERQEKFVTILDQADKSESVCLSLISIINTEMDKLSVRKWAS